MYRVRFTLPERALQHADAVFRIDRDGKRIGTLEVSSGALVWKARGKQKGVYVRWADLGRRLARKSS
jgi:hypothetical protein